jgi:hypothetical protein
MHLSCDRGGVLFEGLHHMQLAMPPGDEDVARGFFVGVLGMTEITKPPLLAARGGVWFRQKGLELHLGVEDDFRPARKGHPGILGATWMDWRRGSEPLIRTSPGTAISQGSAASTQATRSGIAWSFSSP